MIHFSLVLSAGPVQQWTGPFSSARHTTPNQYFPLSRRARVERIGWAGPREGNRAGNVRSRRPVPPARRDVLQAESLKGDGTLGSNKNKKWGKATIAGLVAAADDPTVVVAVRNSPRQTVLAGPRPGLSRIAAAASRLTAS